MKVREQDVQALVERWRQEAEADWHEDYRLESEVGIRKKYDIGHLRALKEQCANELAAILSASATHIRPGMVPAEEPDPLEREERWRIGER